MFLHNLQNKSIGHDTLSFLSSLGLSQPPLNWTNLEMLETAQCPIQQMYLPEVDILIRSMQIRVVMVSNTAPGIASTKAFLRIIGIGDGIYPHPGHTQRPIPNPSQMQLPLLTDSIDACFARCHPIYPTMHESMFRAQMMELVDRPSGDIWQMLLYTVAALGAFSVPTDKNDANMALFEVAKAQFLNEMMEVGNISVVQALVLMSVYLRNRYKLNSSYSFLGLANRIAMGIGLYKEFPSSTSVPFFRGTRWCLWCCFYTLNLEDSIAYSSLKISRRAKSKLDSLLTCLTW